jgi:AcrR family transcriptional regulator
MPKQQFYSISETKRKNFLDAARSELTTKPYSEVSISSIAKRANISRGTFYNYFDSVGELLTYFIEEIRQIRYEYLPKIYEEENYEIFRTFKRLFEYDYEAFERTKKYSLIRNYFTYLHSEKKSLTEHFFKLILSGLEEYSNHLIYKEETFSVSEEEFYQSLEMFGMVLSNLILQVETSNLTKEEMFGKFEFAVDLFEKAVKK